MLRSSGVRKCLALRSAQRRTYQGLKHSTRRQAVYDQTERESRKVAVSAEAATSVLSSAPIPEKRQEEIIEFQQIALDICRSSGSAVELFLPSIIAYQGIPDSCETHAVYNLQKNMSNIVNNAWAAFPLTARAANY